MDFFFFFFLHIILNLINSLKLISSYNICRFPQSSKSVLKRKSSPQCFQPTFPVRGLVNNLTWLQNDTKRLPCLLNSLGR